MARWPAMAVVTALILAGCATAPPQDEPEPVQDPEVRDPGDFSYLDDPENASRPHVHDYWGDERTLTVVDAEGSLGGDALGGPYTLDLEPLPGALVNPGTRWVNATIEWSASGPADPGVRLQWASANRSQGACVCGQFNQMESGRTYSLNTTEDMNDPPHSGRTRWNWYVALDDTEEKVDLQVRIQIERMPGPLPVSPPHPDFWGNRSRLLLVDQTGPLDAAVGMEPPRSFAMDAPHIVPPRTTQLDLVLWYNSSTHPTTHYSPKLSWHAADGGETGGDAPPTTANVASQDGWYRWTIPVAPQMWDSPYVNTTAWTFFVFWTEQLPVGQAPSTMKGDWHLEMIVTREA